MNLWEDATDACGSLITSRADTSNLGNWTLRESVSGMALMSSARLDAGKSNGDEGPSGGIPEYSERKDLEIHLQILNFRHEILFKSPEIWVIICFYPL